MYTLWNFRREIILSLRDKAKEGGDDSDQLDKVLKDELELTSIAIQKNIKSYSAWHHRCWLLDIIPNIDLNKEIELCNQLLEQDSRNCRCCSIDDHS